MTGPHETAALAEFMPMFGTDYAAQSDEGIIELARAAARMINNPRPGLKDAEMDAWAETWAASAARFRNLIRARYADRGVEWTPEFETEVFGP